MIYFIQGSLTGLIKIGHTTYIKSRFKALESACSEKIYVIKTIPGDSLAERRLHEKFFHLRYHGEWFYPGKDLLEYIAKSRTFVVLPEFSEIGKFKLK
jgi:hypothetical protein